MNQPSSQPDVNPEAPWLGLRPFDEVSSAYFFGRVSELNDLGERVVNRRVTLLYGRSGLGKTSLLRAGLVNWLRKRSGFVPVIIRLDYGDPMTSPEVHVLTE